MPFTIFETPVNIKKDTKTGEVREVKSMQDIQYLGALNTYYKRYLYLNAFGITDGDVIDSMNNEELKAEKKETKKADTNYRDLVIDYCNDNNIDLNEIAQTYKLNAKSSNKDFEQVYFDLTLFKEGK